MLSHLAVKHGFVEFILLRMNTAIDIVERHTATTQVPAYKSSVIRHTRMPSKHAADIALPGNAIAKIKGNTKDEV